MLINSSWEHSFYFSFPSLLTSPFLRMSSTAVILPASAPFAITAVELPVVCLYHDVSYPIFPSARQIRDTDIACLVISLCLPHCSFLSSSFSDSIAPHLMIVALWGHGRGHPVSSPSLAGLPFAVSWLAVQIPYFMASSCFVGWLFLRGASPLASNSGLQEFLVICFPWTFPLKPPLLHRS